MYSDQTRLSGAGSLYGAIGAAVDIVARSGEAPPSSPHARNMVRSPKYIGPVILENDPNVASIDR